MQVHITARHLELTNALADYVQKKLQRVGRHFESIVRAQVVLAVEKHRHIAEVVVHATGHHDFRAKGESLDLYAAVDMVAEKLHKHMARQKDRRVRGRRRIDKRLLIEPISATESSASEAGIAEPLVTREKRFTPQPLTIPQAIAELERNNLSFLVFSNEGELAIIYKRPDRSYGLLAPNV